MKEIGGKRSEVGSVSSSSKRTVFTKHQLKQLEQRFTLQTFLSKEERAQLAEQLSLTEKQIMIWFQNRRGRLKKRGPADMAYTREKLKELHSRRPYPFLYGLLSSAEHRSTASHGRVHPYFSGMLPSSDADPSKPTWAFNYASSLGKGPQHPTTGTPTSNGYMPNIPVPYHPSSQTITTCSQWTNSRISPPIASYQRSSPSDTLVNVSPPKVNDTDGIYIKNATMTQCHNAPVHTQPGDGYIPRGASNPEEKPGSVTNTSPTPSATFYHYPTSTPSSSSSSSSTSPTINTNPYNNILPDQNRRENSPDTIPGSTQYTGTCNVSLNDQYHAPMSYFQYDPRFAMQSNTDSAYPMYGGGGYDMNGYRTVPEPRMNTSGYFQPQTDMYSDYNSSYPYLLSSSNTLNSGRPQLLNGLTSNMANNALTTNHGLPSGDNNTSTCYL